MSTALYRRYRPETFAEVIGQEHVTEPLMVALEKNRVNHAYLFSGPRGCGKTTSARILARCLNCAQGPTPTPCGVCDSCRELSRDGGGSLDVIEMDAASHGGVDHARDLRERATLAPVRDRYKIFIIDEAHMVTREGFNALLKIVEEPPEHVKFIFATTEPNKVLGTIRSRTHHYPFRLVPPEVLLPFLQGLCDQEQVPVEPGVLQLVIRAGGGSVRDSLSILDQLMAGASSQNGIEYDRAVALLGYTHAQLLDEVIEALGAKDAPTLFGAVSRVVATGQDPRRFVEDLLERLRDLIVVKAVPQAAGQILQGVPQDQLERLAQQAQALGERELAVAAGTANETLNGMTGAANPQLQLELLCARLLLPAVEGSAGGAEVAALASRLQVLERRVASGAAGSAPAGSGPAQGGMSAARAAGMAAAGLTPKTQASSAPVQEAAQPAQQVAPQQSGSQQGSSQHASAGAPPLAGAPLSAAPLAQTAQAPATQAPVAPAGAPLAGNAPAAPHAPEAPNAQASAVAAAAGTPSAPLKLDPNDPLAAVQGNWRAILNRMSVPGAAEQLMKVRPARMDGATLYVSADIATLRAVKGFVPELTARVSEFLRRQVTIHAQVAKPGEQVKPAAQPTPAAQPAAPSAPAAQPAVPAAVAPQVPQQPVQQTPPQSAQPAPLADGPRGGEDAWRRHGQPLTGANTPESTSVDAPLGAWEVAPIPQSAPEEAPQQATPVAPQAPVQEAPVQEVPAGPLAPEPPVAQQVPTTPAGGFGERDSFAASGSGVPQQESAPEPQQAQEPQHVQEPPHLEEPPYEEEPPFEDEPAYAEPVEAPTAPATPALPSEHVAPAGPLAAPPQAAPVAPAGPLDTPIAPAGPLATPPQAAPTDNAPVDNAPAREEKPEQPATQTSTAPTTTAPAAPAQAARPTRAASDEDYVSEDDEKVENSTFIGLRAIEKVIGGTVIDERPLHQP